MSTIKDRAQAKYRMEKCCSSDYALLQYNFTKDFCFIIKSHGMDMS